jgi:DNA (cytosine-5)-methyltransferase 3A
MGFKLFMGYVKALEESGCRYFLYENNDSIHQNIKNEISRWLGVQPIMINSALVSAQQRKRCYWTNIPNVTQPADKGVLIEDIIESGLPVRYNRNDGVISAKDKAMTVLASDWKGLNRNQTQNAVAEPVILQREHGFNKGGTKRWKSPTVTASVGFPFNNLVAVPVRVGQLGKGGQAQRIYSVHGKAVSLQANSGGQGGKTGLYKIDLPDGNYIIRKLTPIEAERLQTLPDNYTAGISDTQRYKCIGNGWTVDVIAHILKGLRT